MVCKVMQKSSETVPIINHSEINITLEQCENIKKQFVRIPKTTLIDMKDTSTKRQASLTSWCSVLDIQFRTWRLETSRKLHPIL